MSNQVIASSVAPPAPAAPTRPDSTERFRGGDGRPGLLVLIPVGSLLFAGLLVIALAMISGVSPAAPGGASLGASAEVQAEADRLVVEESEDVESAVRLGLTGGRR